MSKPIGAAGLALIQKWEGCRLEAYKAVPTEEHWTIGWGHYGPDVRSGDKITQAEADALLRTDCQRFANAVDSVKYVPLTAQLSANQRDALISFAFNCGEGCLQTLCKNRSLAQIRDAMAKYTLAGGKSLLGLERRRADEQKLFDTPVEKEESMIYKYLADVPEKFRPIIADLMSADIIQGDGSDPTGNGDVINLTHEQVRTLVFVYRGGGFDRKLQSKGLPTAVR